MYEGEENGLNQDPGEKETPTIGSVPGAEGAGGPAADASQPETSPDPGGTPPSDEPDENQKNSEAPADSALEDPPEAPPAENNENVVPGVS